MQESSPSVTTREAVLASLLAHACLIIYVLVFPGTFKGGVLVPAPRDPNAPIPMSFLSQPASPESPEISFGDKGRETVGEPRPPEAAPPENRDPYSIGNTPNRFVAPPMPDRTVPAPAPGGPPAPSAAGEESARGDAARDPAAGEEAIAANRDSSRSAFHTPPQGEPGGSGKSLAGGGTLREALGRMSVEMSAGGAPLKYHNPTGGISGPAGGLSFETSGFDWGPYARKIYWVIWSNWMRGWPPAAWAGLKGVVTVRFRIWKDGRISGIEVVGSSGTEAFDTCATLALEASSPLPPLPEDFTKESEGITARFLYNTDVQEE